MIVDFGFLIGRGRIRPAVTSTIKINNRSSSISSRRKPSAAADFNRQALKALGLAVANCGTTPGNCPSSSFSLSPAAAPPLRPPRLKPLLRTLFRFAEALGLAVARRLRAAQSSEKEPAPSGPTLSLLPKHRAAGNRHTETLPIHFSPRWEKCDGSNPPPHPITARWRGLGG